MKTYSDYGIEIPPHKVAGEVTVLCPECSHTRKKKRDKCLSVNLKAMLGINGLQQQLKNALSKLDVGVDKFLQHTGINSILSRLNSALGEITQIANMVNFCGKPITPISITCTSVILS